MTWNILMVLLASVLLAVAGLLGQRRAAKDRHFDERQRILRGNGYRLGFVVILVLSFIWMFVLEFSELTFISPTLGMLIVVMAGIVSFAVYCICKDAFFSIGEHSLYYILLSAGVVLMNGGLAAGRIADGTFWEGGVITFTHGSNAVIALSFFVVLVALIVKRLRLKKEEAE